PLEMPASSCTARYPRLFGSEIARDHLGRCRLPDEPKHTRSPRQMSVTRRAKALPLGSLMLHPSPTPFTWMYTLSGGCGVIAGDRGGKRLFRVADVGGLKVRWRNKSSSYSFKLPFSPNSKRSLLCRGL